VGRDLWFGPARHALAGCGLRRLASARASVVARGARQDQSGRRYRVKLKHSRGYQLSPFLDGTKSGSKAHVINLDNDEELHYGLLVPFMIERYGFYEGEGDREPARSPASAGGFGLSNEVAFRPAMNNLAHPAAPKERYFRGAKGDLA
jgi:hypothetical protein